MQCAEWRAFKCHEMLEINTQIEGKLNWRILHPMKDVLFENLFINISKGTFIQYIRTMADPNLGIKPCTQWY